MGLLIFFIIILIIDLLFSALIVPLPVSDTDTVRYKSIPWATIAIMVVNVLVFVLWQLPDIVGLFQAQNDNEALNFMLARAVKNWTYGFRASTLQDSTGIGGFVTFTSMFMHADPSHLFFNMVFLWTFGRRVEDACGHWRFLLYYLFAGMIGNMGSGILNPAGRDVPSIGASGAISGVMGAYLMLFPTAWVNCFWVIAFGLRILGLIFGPLMGGDRPKMVWTVRVPAIVLLVLFAVENLVPSFQTITKSSEVGGVNHIAHLTGFLAALAIFFFVRKDLLMRYFAGRSL